MSVQHLTINNMSSQQFNRPSIMLPDPTKYQLHQPHHHQQSYTQTTSSTPQFTLPPIRELLKSTSPAQIPAQAVTSTPSQLAHQPQQQIAPAPLRPVTAPVIQTPSSQPNLYQPQPNGYQSPFSNPISPIAHTPEQTLRQQQQTPPNVLAHHSYHHQAPQQYYSHQPPQFQQQQQQQQQSPNHLPTLHHAYHHQINEVRSSSTSPVSSADGKDKLNTRKKRQNLPRQTTLILLSWLSEHLDRPYPNSREKYELLMKTRLTIQQLDNWFINARRRKINILKKLKETDQNIA